MDDNKVVELITVHKTLLEQLSNISSDHEKRLRMVEKVIIGIMAVATVAGYLLKVH